MYHKRKQAAQDVARKLFEFETALDQALAAGAKLAAEMPEARMRADLSAVVGHDAMAKVGEALAGLYVARGKIVDAHHDLADVHELIGLKVFASGSGWKPPSALAPNLELVSSRAA